MSRPVFYVVTMMAFGLLVACSADAKYRQAEAVMKAFLIQFETLSQALDHVATAPTAAKALNDFSLAMATYKKAMRDLYQQYPDLDLRHGAQSAEFQLTVSQVDLALQKLAAVIGKAQSYFDDDAVRQAAKKAYGMPDDM